MSGRNQYLTCEHATFSPTLLGYILDSPMPKMLVFLMELVRKVRYLVP